MPISNGLRTMKQVGQERIICELSNLQNITVGCGVLLFHYFLWEYLKNSNEDFFLRSRDLLYLTDDLITFSENFSLCTALLFRIFKNERLARKKILIFSYLGNRKFKQKSGKKKHGKLYSEL